jgi:hypothetical protein
MRCPTQLAGLRPNINGSICGHYAVRRSDGKVNAGGVTNGVDETRHGATASSAIRLVRGGVERSVVALTPTAGALRLASAASPVRCRA